MFSSVVVFEHRTVAINQVAEGAERTTFRVHVDGRYRGEIDLSPFSSPGLALANGRLGAWGGMSLFVFDLAGSGVDRIDVDDEIHAAYSLGDRWCVVCETSVVLLDVGRRSVIDLYDHDEVILSSWWTGETLVVEDLQRRRFGLDFREKPARLPAPQRLDSTPPSSSPWPPPPADTAP